jgi:hypothetical protein
MESRGADVGFIGTAIAKTFMTIDAAKWRRVASYAKISLG